MQDALWDLFTWGDALILAPLDLFIFELCVMMVEWMDHVCARFVGRTNGPTLQKAEKYAKFPLI